MIPESIKKLAQKVRTEIYGRDVRESIAQSMEVSGETSNEANERSKDTATRQTDVENRFDDQIAGNTDIDEVIDARRPEGGKSYPTLRKRLDDEHKEVTTQLAQTITEFSVRTPVKYGKIKLPNDFIDIDFDLYRKPDGKVYHNIDVDKRYRNKDIERTIYTSIANGNNVNGDGSEANPYRTPAKALEVASSTTEKNIKIIVDGDAILRNEFFVAINSFITFTNKHIILTTKNNKKIPVLNGDSSERPSRRLGEEVNAAPPAWTLTTGNVYQTTRSNTSFIIDLEYRDEFTGLIKKMHKASSIDECNNVAGSYYIDGATVYVHTFNNRPTDGKVACIFRWGEPHSAVRLYNSLFFMENFEFVNYDGMTFRGDTKSHFVYSNCDFGETATTNSLTLLHAGKTYLLNCTTHDSHMDGFNYHYPTRQDNRDCFVFEYDCFGHNNGNEQNGTGNNYSTGHDGASFLRVNSIGEESQGVLCADVNGSYSILIDCQMENSKLPSSNLRSASYQFTTDSGILPAKAVLINSSGTSPNWSILTDEQNGTELILESWFEGLENINRTVSL